MKTLIVHDGCGNIVFTQTTNIENTYGCFIEEIPECKRPLRVDIKNNKCILGDSFEIEEQKKKLKEQLEEQEKQEFCKLQNSQNELKNKKNEILETQANLIELEYKKYLL